MVLKDENVIVLDFLAAGHSGGRREAIAQVLGLKYFSLLEVVIKKDIAVRKHIERNSKDETARRGLILTESKIKRLVKYYKKAGKIPEEWKYDPRRVRFYIE